MSERIRLDLLETRSPAEVLQTLKDRFEFLRPVAHPDAILEIETALFEAEHAVQNLEGLHTAMDIYRAVLQMESKLSILLLMVAGLQVYSSGWTEEELTDMAEQSKLQAVQVIGGEE